MVLNNSGCSSFVCLFLQHAINPLLQPVLVVGHVRISGWLLPVNKVVTKEQGQELKE